MIAAENAARTEAIARVGANVERIGADLKAEFQRVWQDKSTSEIIEASRGAGERVPGFPTR